MTKRKTGCLSRHRLGIVRAVWLASTMAVALAQANKLPASDLVHSSSSSSNTVTAWLACQETDYAVLSGSVGLKSRPTSFKKEPAQASGRIFRGVLNFGADPSNSIAFIWQCGEGKLCLDLNRNQDLTDDPAGVFFSGTRPTTDYETFTNVHLLLNTAVGRCPVLADISFWAFGSRPICRVAMRSFWQGKLTLHGRDWQAGIVQDVLRQSGSLENGRLLLRAWEKRSQPFDTRDGSLATIPFSRKLFVDGSAYQLDLVLQSQDGAVKPALQFVEQPVPLGELKITGKFIQRLVLPGGPCLVVLDRPAASVPVPAGSYLQPDIVLEENGAEAFSRSGEAQAGGRIIVAGNTPVVLNVGGPLTNSVAASRHGQELRLDYCLVGVGGEPYQLAGQNRSKPPEFAIYKGAKQVASGKFEFG